MRVVRFYVCGPSFLPSFFFLFLLAVLFARCRQMSTWTSRVQWAMPDLNREFQIAVGSADLNRGAPKRTGQRRTSTGELQSGLGNAGPQPGSSKADWATPDLNQGAPERSGQRRTSAARRYVRRCVRNMLAFSKSSETPLLYCVHVAGHEIGFGGVYFGYGWLGTVGWVRVRSFGYGCRCGYGWLGTVGTVRRTLTHVPVPVPN